MSKADDMFEKKGYKMQEKFNGYLYTDETGFNIKVTNMKRVDLYYKETPTISLTLEELKAINEKFKEMKRKGELMKEANNE